MKASDCLEESKRYFELRPHSETWREEWLFNVMVFCVVYIY